MQRVRNELQVVPSAKQPAVKAQDDEIEREVKKALQNHEDFKGVNVAVKNCVARLTGTVPTGMQRLDAAVERIRELGVVAELFQEAVRPRLPAQLRHAAFRVGQVSEDDRLRGAGGAGPRPRH